MFFGLFTDVSHESMLLSYSSALQISLRESEEKIKQDEEGEREKDCSYWRQMREIDDHGVYV